MEKIRTLADAKKTMSLLDDLLKYVDVMILKAEHNPELRDDPKLAEFKRRRVAYQRDFEALQQELAAAEELEKRWGDDEYTYRPTGLDGRHPGSQG